jgi:hypothetical protein
LTAFVLLTEYFVDASRPQKKPIFLALWAILATNNKEARSGAEFQAALAVAKP